MRYTQQAAWTVQLRHYVMSQAGAATAQRILEVGCGTGAVLQDTLTTVGKSPGSPAPTFYGLDIAYESLTGCAMYAPAALPICGDALRLPMPPGTFDVTFCHFLLLWVKHPLQALLEMKRVTRAGGYVMALAEPDYTAREDRPAELARFGDLQTLALENRGADVDLGSRLTSLYAQAGIRIIESGRIERTPDGGISPEEHEQELSTLVADLEGILEARQIEELRALDAAAFRRGERRVYVPTYFAWGQV